MATPPERQAQLNALREDLRNRRAAAKASHLDVQAAEKRVADAEIALKEAKAETAKHITAAKAAKAEELKLEKAEAKAEHHK